MKLIRFRCLLILVFALCCSAITSSSSADFSDDFESYPLGNIDGHGPWVDFGGTLTTKVSDLQADSGSHSLALTIGPVDNNPVTPGYGSDVFISAVDGTFVTSGQWRFSYSLFVPDTFDGRLVMFLSQGDMGVGDFTAGAQWTADNRDNPPQLEYAAGSQTELILGQWGKVEALIDLDADTIDVSYDGAPFYSGVWNEGNAATLQIGGLNAWVQDGSQGSVYVDDLQLIQVPEPATLGLVWLALACAVVVSRRCHLPH